VDTSRQKTRPYHPHQNGAFKRGEVPIWEIPVSAAIVPFTSSAPKVLGLSAMKVLFRLLYAESQRTGKPIVYLAHPTEFAGVGQREKKTFRERCAKHIRCEYFSPSFIRTHGLRLRNLLYTTDADTMLADTQELFAYMASFADVKFMTMSEYVTRLDTPGGAD
jgi:hypothetical protein